MGFKSTNCVLQLDIQAVYEQGEGAQVAQLQRALENPQGAASADAEALRRMLGRIVWTPSMRRMYTLLNRWACDCCSACGPRKHGPTQRRLWWLRQCSGVWAVLGSQVGADRSLSFSDVWGVLGNQVGADCW